MASCAACSSVILFGGKRVGDDRYCNDKCVEAGQVIQTCENIPHDVVLAEARKMKSDACPACGNKGRPVEVFTSHRAVSYILMTTWSSHPQVSCRSCHFVEVAKNSILTLLVGWWGFPWGLLATPIQLLRNGIALFQTGDSPEPSEALLAQARITMGQKLAADTSRPTFQ